MRTEKIEIYQGGGSTGWRWRYRATNGKILADGGEGYAARGDAIRGALRVTGLDIPTYVGDIDRLARLHAGTPFGRSLEQHDRRLTHLVRGRLYYFFDALVTDRPYDVELVQL